MQEQSGCIVREMRVRVRGYIPWVGGGGGASNRAKLLLIIHNGSILLIFQILPNRKYILTGSPQIPSRHVPIRVRQQMHELVQLKIEICGG